MTLDTKKTSCGVSKDENPTDDGLITSVLAESGSNINIIQQNDIRLRDIPESYENRPGTLDGMGTSPTLGVLGLVYTDDKV